MTTIQLEKSDLTPAVNFNAEQRLMEIDGRCIPEDSHAFFTPLIHWVGDLFENKTPNITEEYNFVIRCEYYNSASAKMLVYLFDKIAEIQKSGHNLVVSWYCAQDDPDMIESINDYISLSDVEIYIKHD